MECSTCGCGKGSRGACGTVLSRRGEYAEGREDGKGGLKSVGGCLERYDHGKACRDDLEGERLHSAASVRASGAGTNKRPGPHNRQTLGAFWSLLERLEPLAGKPWVSLI